MQHNDTTVSRSAISARAEKAESLSCALMGINRLLSENTSRRECDGDAPFMDGFTEGCMYEVLNVISGAMLDLSGDIEALGGRQESDNAGAAQ